MSSKDSSNIFEAPFKGGCLDPAMSYTYWGRFAKNPKHEAETAIRTSLLAPDDMTRVAAARSKTVAYSAFSD
jgi:hypothetical protein